MGRTKTFPAVYRRFLLKQRSKRGRLQLKHEFRQCKEKPAAFVSPDVGDLQLSVNDKLLLREQLKEEIQRLQLELIKVDTTHLLLLKLVNAYYHHDSEPLRVQLQETHRRLWRITGIETLPNELFGYILSLALTKPLTNAGPARSDLGACQLVSRRWRDLCVNTPTIWCRWDLTTPTDYELDRRNFGFALNSAIARAKAAPISLRLNHPRRDEYGWPVIPAGTASPDGMNCICDVLHNLSANIRVLDVIFGYRDTTVFANLVATALPGLETLTISTFDENVVLPFFLQSRRLRHLSISEGTLLCHPIGCHFQSMETLRVTWGGEIVEGIWDESWNLSDWLASNPFPLTNSWNGGHIRLMTRQVLDKMVGLKELHLEAPFDLQDQDVLHLEHVQRLRLTLDRMYFYRPEPLHSITQLHLPNLRDLRLEWSENIHGYVQTTALGTGFLHVMYPFARHLVRLSMHGGGVDEQSLHDLLHLSRDLEELVLSNHNLTGVEGLLRMLKWETAMLCPQLSRFELLKVRGDASALPDALEFSCLLDFLKSRRDGARLGECQRIKYLRIDTIFLDPKGQQEDREHSMDTEDWNREALASQYVDVVVDGVAPSGEYWWDEVSPF